MKHVISLGAGVQSSTMALMAAQGEIGPMPDCAIFADVGWEPPEVYTWLDWLEKQLPFPVHRVGGGNIREAHMELGTGMRVKGVSGDGKRLQIDIPVFTLDGDGNKGMIQRQCTKMYKLEPIYKFMRTELLGLAYRERAQKGVQVIQWIGISLDEIQRMKPSRTAWLHSRHPLIHDVPMHRLDCLEWMDEKYGVRPPRSACIGCPFHSDEEWRGIRDNPESWADAVAFDRAIRSKGRDMGSGISNQLYLHSTCKPLEDVDLDTETTQVDMFNMECEGMCGV